MASDLRGAFSRLAPSLARACWRVCVVAVATCSHGSQPVSRAWGQSAPIAPAASSVPAVPAWAKPEATRGPWPARHRHGVRVMEEGVPPALVVDSHVLTHRRLRSLGLRGGARTRIEPQQWPAEPVAPTRVDPLAFEAALGCLCPPAVPDQAVARIARATLDAAAVHAVDPFLLASLAFHQSRCEARTSDSYGVGLTRINLGMHNNHIRAGAYHYGRRLADGQYVHETIPVHGHMFTSHALLRPETNLFFAAAFLRVFAAQCPGIDAPFESAPHRHPVSHVVFGDQVRSALPEALLLTVRRRMLAYYDAQSVPACMGCERALALQRQRERAGVNAATAIGSDVPASVPSHVAPLGSPLDGAPRIVIGVLGDARDQGARLHAGIDLIASEGEPVRSVQAGVVISAGVDLRKQGLLDLPPERAALVPLNRMGARGLFVRVSHPNGLVSIYAHLARYQVQVGDRVVRGQLLGQVGLTGVQASDAHLHFGLFDGERVLNPLDWLAPHLIYDDARLAPDR